MSSQNETILEKSLKKLWSIYKFNYKIDPFTLALKKWMDDMGESTHRLYYPLTEKSTVIDVGAHLGEWAHKIVSLYNPYLFLFEPVEKYYNLLLKQFQKNKKVKIYKSALADKTAEGEIYIQGSKSSTEIKVSSNKEKIKYKDVLEFFKENNLKDIDLIKINIEGGEYALLKRIINTSLVNKFKNIQIQFHKINRDSEKMREELRAELSKTHELTYDYYFTWENWKRRRLNENDD